MGIIISFISLITYIIILSLYRIFQSAFLQKEKVEIEEKGFLTYDLISFLEFVMLVLVFLIVEILVLDLPNFLFTRVAAFIIFFGLLIADDVILRKKIQPKK